MAGKFSRKFFSDINLDDKFFDASITIYPPQRADLGNVRKTVSRGGTIFDSQ